VPYCIVRNQKLGDDLFVLRYITLHSLDSKLIKMTVGYGICHKYRNILTVQLKFSHKKTQENTVVTHKDIQKYIHMCTMVGQNNGNTTGTVHISLLIWRRTTFWLQYSHSLFGMDSYKF
jgi:hypothetical protein